MAQQISFDEIVVVDNNSTDKTLWIARTFPNVRIVRETRQGVVHARSTGFDHARGDIIARIDADTRLPADWTQQLLTIFADDTVDAVSGRMQYYDMAAHRLINRVDLSFRRYFARVLGDEVALQAANMAIRRQAWQLVRTEVCRLGNLHEDFDLAIHANQTGHRVVFDERLVAHIGYRQAGSSFGSFCRYAWLSPHTYRYHRSKGHRYMYPVVGLAIVSYGLLKVLHRGCDPVDGQFSLRRLFTPPKSWRVNPATYVD